VQEQGGGTEVPDTGLLPRMGHPVTLRIGTAFLLCVAEVVSAAGRPARSCCGGIFDKSDPALIGWLSLDFGRSTG